MTSMLSSLLNLPQLARYATKKYKVWCNVCSPMCIFIRIFAEYLPSKENYKMHFKQT